MTDYGTDTYPDDEVPDIHVEICLRVIRTVRNLALQADSFDADIAVLLSHAHKFIVNAVEDSEDGQESSPTPTETSDRLIDELAKAAGKGYEPIVREGDALGSDPGPA